KLRRDSCGRRRGSSTTARTRGSKGSPTSTDPSGRSSALRPRFIDSKWGGARSRERGKASCSTHHGARMPPTLILLVGMATILAGIVLLRLNAFLALIIAAIVVSLLAPGQPASKIARVAEGFGRTAGTVGIVIALAAITGKAMTDSGAADRIVNGFLALLGEKRGATALCSTGYILSIPVFFEPVLYLLVPLSRVMYWRSLMHS